MFLAAVGLCGLVGYVAIAGALTVLLGRHFRRRSGYYRHRQEDGLAEADRMLADQGLVFVPILNSPFHAASNTDKEQ